MPLFSFLLAPGYAACGNEICPAGLQLNIHIGAQVFDVEVADSSTERQRGLSGRRELSAGSGMWFEFESPGWYGFWMREMNFPIDLIWISPNHTVLGVITLQPCAVAPCPTSIPPAPISHVLEINAGEFSGKPGDQVKSSCTAIR